MHPSGEQAIARARISWANVNFISSFPMRVRSGATADRGAHLPSHPAHRTSLRLRRPSPPPSPRPSIATAVEASVHRRRAPPPPSPASPPATQPDCPRTACFYLWTATTSTSTIAARPTLPTTHTSPPLHRHAYHRLHRHHHDRRRPLYAALPPVSPIPSPPSPSPLKSPPALTCGACWGWPRKCECTFACACPPNLRTHGNRPACACAPLPGPRSAQHSPLTTFRLVSWQVSM